ncbi:37S ribosomal protein PET123, mitochondrial [Neolecta irregularis DAH-3]|uniref:37S ribosomal protein PET123, mitochondrial n=1 Tax=Neolecta irregularis (strain DAH-3) TaxID=1198029 RepID=A0A1U7LHT3_NEOID|nr:37S ribosomal protein PET123, mitochondrial [Neolecta irregularis DAH-3]|eukprot:OLL22216.1 37S ribosomal protein PET123, mitochondrial [Neolecta irregularis DAH-3]
MIPRRRPKCIPGKFGYARGIVPPPRSTLIPKPKKQFDPKKIAPPPTRKRSPVTPLQVYRCQMANTRRLYLAEGYRSRKIAIAKAADEARRKSVVLAKHVRIDFPTKDHFTLPSIPELLKEEDRTQIHPSRLSEIAEQKKQNRLTFDQRKRHEKLQYLLDLYHSADLFCTTEEHLDASIDLAFKDEYINSPNAMNMNQIMDELNCDPSVPLSGSLGTQLVERKSQKIANALRGTAGDNDVGIREIEIAKMVLQRKIRLSQAKVLRKAQI